MGSSFRSFRVFSTCLAPIFYTLPSKIFSEMDLKLAFISAIIFTSYSTATQVAENKRCPEAYPYAFLRGRYCCEYDREDIFQIFGERCDGGPISLKSLCCINN